MPGSDIAILMRDSTTSSCRMRPGAVARLARNLAGASNTSRSSGSASGATIPTALRVARARLASAASRALRHTSSAAMRLSEKNSAAACVQPSSALAQPIPVAQYLVGRAGGRGALDLVHEQGVAAHFAVVVHAVERMQFAELRPVAALADEQQPVVAQPVFLVGAGVALQEGRHVLRRGLVEPGAQFPVGAPGFQHVAAHVRQELREPRAVAPAVGLLHL